MQDPTQKLKDFLFSPIWSFVQAVIGIATVIISIIGITSNAAHIQSIIVLFVAIAVCIAAIYLSNKKAKTPLSKNQSQSKQTSKYSKIFHRFLNTVEIQRKQKQPISTIYSRFLVSFNINILVSFLLGIEFGMIGFLNLNDASSGWFNFLLILTFVGLLLSFTNVVIKLLKVTLKNIVQIKDIFKCMGGVIILILPIMCIIGIFSLFKINAYNNIIISLCTGLIIIAIFEFIIMCLILSPLILIRWILSQLNNTSKQGQI